jgi:hypothetical protein
MIRKTQEEVNFWFQDNAVKSALDLTLIEKKLHNNGLDIPNIIIINKNGSTYEDFAHWYYDETKISKYPKTYEECAILVDCPETKSTHWLFDFDPNRKSTFYRKVDILMGKMALLLICRQAYWKIAGEEMGLGKPWEPTTETVYGISRTANLICQTHRYGNSKILEFPSKEMRDEFYENFKDLIEACKTLL